MKPMRFCFAVIACALPCRVQGATYYVAQQIPTASDQNAGTEDRPLKTIGAAMAKVELGDSVYVKNGVYREAVVWDRADRRKETARTTLSAYPGHRPVIKGSEIVPGPWTQMAGEPIYSCPWNDYAQMVFFDEMPLKQIGLQGSPERAEKGGGFRFRKQWDGKGVDDMRPGTFYYDKDEKQLHVWLPDGGDPGDYVIEAAVRSTGISTRGTWTISGFDVRHVKDGCRKHTAIGSQGIGVIVEACRITHNGPMGLIVVGADCVIRNCEIAYNGLCGLSCPNSVRMLVEGNECHHNAWRGDVVCLHHSNKITRWNDCQFLRNHFHHEATGLWLDINVNNALVAENLFEDCRCGLYYEISRWGVLMNNIIVDSPGAYVSVNEASAYGWGNCSDYNVFAWTLPAYHPSADHIKFASGWHRYYANLAFWRRERHYGEHSVIADLGVYQKVHEGFRYVYVGKQDVAAAVGFVDRERGDYRLAVDSPLLGRGIGTPAILNSACPRVGPDLVRPDAWAATQLKIAQAGRSQGVGPGEGWPRASLEHARRPVPSNPTRRWARPLRCGECESRGAERRQDLRPGGLCALGQLRAALRIGRRLIGRKRGANGWQGWTTDEEVRGLRGGRSTGEWSCRSWRRCPIVGPEIGGRICRGRC